MVQIFQAIIVQDAGEVIANTGMHSFRANIELKIFMARTGLILGSVLKTGAAAHSDSLHGSTKAIKKAVHKAIDDYLINTITHSFQDYLNNGAPMKVIVTGVSSFKTYKRVSKTIDFYDRVVSCKKDGWNKPGGVLVLDIRFKGSSEDLAEILDGMKIGKQKLEVEDFAGDRVDCNFK